MKEKEKQVISLMAQTMELLPEEKKQYVLGFIEGIASMANQSRNKSEDQAMSA